MTEAIEKAKAVAAKAAVEQNLNSSCVIGIGSGSTMVHVLEQIVRVCKEKKIKVKCVPTSFQSKQLILDYQLRLTDLDSYPTLDLAFDGADEIDKHCNAIKGGGACLGQEKVVAGAAKKFVVVADNRKDSKFLGQNWKKGLPIEVLPMATNHVRHRICEMFSSDLFDINVRIGKEKAGPVVTDNGNFILDWIFDTELTRSWDSENWHALSLKITTIPGVVEAGIFSKMIDEIFFGYPSGKVEMKRP